MKPLQVVFFFAFAYIHGGRRMIICECGELIEGCTFRDYIATSASPSTPTVGHIGCGLIFNFIDEERPKRFSSKVKLKSIAMRLAKKRKLCNEDSERLLIEVDRLKSSGNLSDEDILVRAYKKLIENRGRY
jgi:hypothetical protein